MATLRLMASRHSAFYTPLLGTIAGGFLEREGLEASYDVLVPGQRSRELLRAGAVEVMQSAVGSNFGPLLAGETNLPVHFAQINTRDGFFIASREAIAFGWKDLEGARVVADHGGQPLLMLKYALRHQGVDWRRLDMVDAGAPDAMVKTFREGQGGFIHLQGPAPQQLEADGVAHVVASVGEAMPVVAFSSLCAMETFLETERARAFTRAYRRSREWARSAPASEIASTVTSFFPDVSLPALTATIARYQELGCWDGDIAIPEALFDQAVEVFRSGGAIDRAPSYRTIVREPPS